jgi:hypothetical protein
MSESTTAQLPLDGFEQLSLLPSQRVPDELRLSPETRRRGLEQLARIRAEVEARRSARSGLRQSAA